MSRNAIKQARDWMSNHTARRAAAHAPYLAPLTLRSGNVECSIVSADIAADIDEVLSFRRACDAAGVMIEDAEARDYVQIAETPDLRRYRIYEVVSAGNMIPLCEVTAHGEVAAAVEAMQSNKVLSADVLDECNISIHVQDLGRCEQ